MSDKPEKVENNLRVNTHQSPTELALSSLQCPSPPPILNTGFPSGQNISSNSINEIIKSEFNEPIENHQSPLAEPVVFNKPSLNNNSVSSQSLKTIPAGGALLRGHVATTAIAASIAARTARDRIQTTSPAGQKESSASPFTGQNLSNSSLSSSDPSQPSPGLKSPDMHAHFYLEDTIKHGTVRSRSNSSNGGGGIEPSRNIGHVLETNEEVNGSNLRTGSANNINQSNKGTLAKKEASQNLDPRLPQDDGKIHILFGACGSIGSSKIKLIIKKLEEIYGKKHVSIHLILTSAAEHFVSRNEFPNVQIWRDRDEWNTWKSRSDPVLHIELRRWADILIVAPLTANTLSKIALGICDNLLTNVIRAWNTQYPVLLAPCMVKYAYSSAPTKRQLLLIKEEMPWIEVLKPVEKIIGSYGDIGMGGMMDYNEVVDKIVHKLGGYPDDDDDDDDDEDEEEDDNDNNDRKKKNSDKDNDDEDEDEDDDEDDDEDEDEGEEEEEENAVEEDDEEKEKEAKLAKQVKHLKVADED